MAHPVRPNADDIANVEPFRIEPGRGEYEPDVKIRHSQTTLTAMATRANVDLAQRRLRWLRLNFPETTFIAPWIASMLGGDDDSDPDQREAGLIDAETTIARCDGVVLTGNRISDGMHREAESGIRSHAFVSRFDVYDLTRPEIESVTIGPWKVGLDVSFRNFVLDLIARSHLSDWRRASTT